jgi:hypothetical protein
MAGFDDSNDIKIGVTLDANNAIESIKRLTDEVNLLLSRTSVQFEKLQKLTADTAKVQIEEIRAKNNIELAAINQATKQYEKDASERTKLAIATAKSEVDAQRVAANTISKILNTEAQERAKLAKLEANEKIASLKNAADLAKSQAIQEAKNFAETEKTKRAEIDQTTQRIKQQAASVKAQAAPSRMVPSLGDSVGSAKLLDGIVKTLTQSVAGLSVQFGNVNVGIGGVVSNIVGNLGPGGKVAAALAGTGAVLQRFNTLIDETAKKAGELEGIKTGFETLQKSIGQAPLSSLKALRDATQGLISDTQLYQRANQAVLLGVPTDTFNSAAAAAVKLGRAMGIDAAFGLESLSLGLGRQSRLYLDNLGIIVSAEEAYRNFGKTVGKSAADLDDAEKKAAFFAEALKKIKERADELPDPLDSVAIAQQKAAVAQDNTNRAFLEAFNNTRSLTEAYKLQAAIVEASSKNAVIFGAVYGELAAVVRDLTNKVWLLTLGFTTGLAQGINALFKVSPEKQVEKLNASISATQKQIEALTSEIEAAKANGGIISGLFVPSKIAEVDRLNANLKTSTERLAYFKQLADSLDNKNIKINIDLSGIENAQEQLQNLFDQAKRGAEEEAGVFKIAGVPEGAAQQVFRDLTAAKVEFDKSLKRTEDLDAYKGKLDKIKETIAGPSIDTAFKNAGSAFAEFANVINNKKGFDEGVKAADKLKDAYADIRTAFKSTGVSVKDVTKIISAAEKQATKIASSRKKDTKETISEFKKQQKELQSFTTSIRRSLERSIPRDIQKELIDIFNSPTENADQLADAIQALGEKFLKAGGDIQAFSREAAALKDLKDAIPNRPLIGTAEQTDAVDKYNERLKSIQQGALNIRDLLLGAENDPSGKKKGGAFFGFDLGFWDSEEARQSEQILAGQIQGFLSSAFEAGLDGFSREDVPQLAAGLGGIIGGGLAAYFSGGDPTLTAAGAQAGAMIGEGIAAVLEPFGKDTAGTRQRKAIDKYFASLFDGGRLAVVIQGQLTGAIDEATGEAIRSSQAQITQFSKIVFEGFTPFAGNVDFGGDNFRNYFDTLSTDIQASFNGIGIAIGTLNGIAIEQTRLIGIAISNNIGDSLQNLQVLIQQTGESFDDLASAVIKSFLGSQISIEEAYNSLVQLQNLYGNGIPGAIGAWEEANRNLFDSLEKNNPGRYAIDSLRDIGSEGAEARKSFEAVISGLAQTFTFTADQQVRLFEALRINGITSLEQLQAASDEKLLAILRNIQIIRDKSTEPLVTTPQVNFEKPIAAPRSSGPKGKSPQEIAADLLKKQREEARGILQDSQRYLNVISDVNKKLITQVDAGKAIKGFQKEILDTIIRRDKVETELNKELDKGRKGNAKRIAELSAELQKLQESLKKTAQTAADSAKTLNLAGIIPLLKSANSLGVVSKLVGVDVSKLSDILVQGFLRGKLSLEEFNKQLKATQENLGKGIPNEVGAVTKAFQNLVDAGVRGGQFSVDAFTDIFAEFREKFQKEGSAIREQQRQELLAALESAKKTAASTIGPEAAKTAKEALDAANKALNDFYETIPAPNLSDLRGQLESVFGVDQIAKFFQAIDESGLRTFSELESAGVDGILPILTRLQELGFKFNETSDEINKINQGLNDAANAANGNKDPIQAALDLIKQFNEGANGLPPAFNSTTDAVQGLNSTLGNLKDGFDDIIEKLTQLNGQTYTNNVVFNIRTTGDASSQALIDVLFGDGANANIGIGNGGGGGGSGSTSGVDAAKLAKKKSRLKYLQKYGRGSSDEAKRLQKEIRDLGG